MEMMLFKNIYSNKKVLITGNTGFKGGWLSLWLHYLGAEVFGFSDQVPTHPSFYEANKLNELTHQTWGDIRDQVAVENCIKKIKPDFIFHLAAQALVKESFEKPLDTFTTNGIGTGVLLDVLKNVDFACTAIFITSDKCYENVEWIWGYKETDALGGKDPYSASKAVAEIIFHAYFNSYFKDHAFVKLATTRAGNVIGGGDWAKDRIVPDCIKSWSDNMNVSIRRPNSTRPWQHVLEPLSGYLLLGAAMAKNKKLVGESFNFGPPANQNKTVKELIIELAQHWQHSPASSLIDIQEDKSFYEAGLLKLNTDKALFHLGWEAILDFSNTVQFTGEWYNFYESNVNDALMVREFSLQQLNQYIDLGIHKKSSWTR